MLAVEYERKNFILGRFFQGNLRTLYTEKFYKDLLTKFYNKGDVVYKRGQKAERVYLVYEGEFSLSVLSMDNLELTVMKCCKGDMVGLECLDFNKRNQRYKYTLTADSINCVIVSATIVQITKSTDSFKFLLETKEKHDKCLDEYCGRSLATEMNRKKILGRDKDQANIDFLKDFKKKQIRLCELRTQLFSSNSFKTFKLPFYKATDLDKLKSECKVKDPITTRVSRSKKVNFDLKTINQDTEQFFITTKDFNDTQEGTLTTGRTIYHNSLIPSYRSHSQILFPNNAEINPLYTGEDKQNIILEREKSTVAIQSLLNNSPSICREKEEMLNARIVHLKSKYRHLSQVGSDLNFFCSMNQELNVNQDFPAIKFESNTNNSKRAINISENFNYNDDTEHRKKALIHSMKINKDHCDSKKPTKPKINADVHVNKFIRKCVNIQKKYEQKKKEKSTLFAVSLKTSSNL